jgi:hypothetical protein
MYSGGGFGRVRTSRALGLMDYERASSIAIGVAYRCKQQQLASYLAGV